MRGAIAWSDALLPPEEQRLFRRLAVFAGGFTLEAVRAVCAPAGGPEKDAWEGVAALVRKSLIRRAEAGPETRFELLDTIREYALERLAASGEAPALRARHAAFYRAEAELAASRLAGREQLVWLERLEREHDNMRAALRWLVDRGDAPGALGLAGELARFWWAHGHREEGRVRLAEVLALPEATVPSGERARALLGAASLIDDRAEAARAVEWLEEALSLFRELGDRHGAVAALELLVQTLGGRGGLPEALRDPDGPAARDLARARTLVREYLEIARVLPEPGVVAGAWFLQAVLASREGNLAHARSLLLASLRIWREQGDRISVAYGLRSLGWTANHQGDLATTRSLLEDSLALFREVGDRWSMARVLGDLGEVMTAQGDYPAARRIYEQGLTLWRALGNRQGIANLQNGLGYVVTEEGDFEGALALFTEALAIRRESGDPARLAWSLAGFAYLAAARGQAARAVRLAGAADALRELSGMRAATSSIAKLERRLVEARAALGEAATASSWAEGRLMTLEAALADALDGAR
jgi:tetratricopeptide (TPR) repeat protein